MKLAVGTTSPMKLDFLDEVLKDLKMFCWATIVDNKGRQLSAQSHQILLPAFHQNILKNNEELGGYVQQYLAENTDSLSQEIGTIVRLRKPFIHTSIKTALLEYFVSKKA